MSERGVFAVDRGIFDHPLFNCKEPLSRREAWLWLLAEAEWKPTKRRVSGVTVELQRGQLAHSVRFIAEAWGWSKSAVDRFLGRLKTEAMIGTESGTGSLVITICKYNDYQKVSLPKRDNNEPATGTAAGQQRDRLENSEYIEPISSLRSDIEPSPPKATPRSHLLSILDDEHAGAILEHRQKLRKPLTERAAKLLAKSLSEFPDPNVAADRMIEKGWSSIDAKWEPRGSPHSPNPQKPRNLAEASTQLLAQMREAGNADTQSGNRPSLAEQDVRYLAIANGERRS